MSPLHRTAALSPQHLADRAGQTAWHAVPIADALKRLASGPAGLAADEVERRLANVGPNTLPDPRRRSILAIVVGQLQSPLIYLLVAAALVSVFMGELTDAIFIFLVLAINTAIGASQEAGAEASTAALSKSVALFVRVRRDGVIVKADSRTLVPGDVVALEAGDRVPADLRLLDAADLQADESSLTGESMPVDKAADGALPQDTPLADRLNMLLAGTLVRRGRCSAMVVETGMRTAIGHVVEALQQPSAQPPLVGRLNRFARLLGIVSLLLVAVIIGGRLLAGADLRSTVFVAVALAISVIPEGLPVAVTVALSVAARRMARRNVVVRNLPAVEGLGACTVIATDKTGTLTLNQLTAKRVWLPGHGVVKIGSDERDTIIEPEPIGPAIARLARSATLVNDASYDPSIGRDGASGDSLDVALLVLAAKAEIEIDSLRNTSPRVADMPFSAERRFAASLNRHEDQHRLHVKGAPEVLLPFCAGADQCDALDEAERMAAEGYRVLAVAAKRVGPAPGRELEDELCDLTLLGLVGFIDPLRPEAKAAIADCRRAGVAVRMITGDHRTTALSIARELGLAQDGGDVATGHDLDLAAAGDQNARDLVARATVFARVEPTQKVQIVEALQAQGHLVAMTGDGVNDAPALQRADVGVAMGRDGTDTARDAADLILADDNFASIVAGIEEGRAAYANIRKVIYLLVSTGVAEAAMFLLALVTGLPLPLGAVQLLWLNLVTNGGQDVALAFERAEPGLLDKPPRRPSEAIFDRTLIQQTAISGVYIGTAGFLVFWWALSQGMPEAEARNIVLFLLVLFENIQAINARSESRSVFRIPLSDNWALVAAIAGAQALQFAAPFIPGLRDVLEVQPVSPGLWAMLLAVALSLLAVTEVERALRRRPTGRSDVQGRLP